MATRLQAIQAVRQYVGEPFYELETAEDPKVPGCWALRDKLGNGFLIQGNLGHAPTEADVEEVDWETWPPVSGELRFFL